VYATESGHNVHLQQPEIIAQEVRWVLGQTS
jgi:pimeloyl-ACP methyl ester carboxylesterase